MKRFPFLVANLFVLSAVFLCATACGLPDGMYAEMETSKGRMVIRLHHDKVPITVANFIALAEGSNGLVATDRKGMPFYDGLTFHKVIPGVMVQCGDPEGTGRGGPGFRFLREFRPDLRHEHPGVLSMLNQGPFSHGSRFFITLKATPRYDDKHSVFGQVVRGQSVAERLEEGDVLKRLSIRRQGKDAEEFDVARHLKRLEQSALEAEEEARRSAREKADRSRNRGESVPLPKLTGRPDPARVPRDGQPEVEEVALEYLLVSHRDAIPRMGNATREKTDAKAMAEHLAALAREEGTDFVALARRFSDAIDHRIPHLVRDARTSEALLPCFRLKVGQVTEPIDTLKGFMVFKRVDLERIEVRHILISYQGAQNSAHTRTQQEARELAREVLRKARHGEDFAALARSYSDSTSAEQGGWIGTIVKGATVPAFEYAAFSLEVNEISEVTLTPSGYQIIQRIE
jgi:cyclophilin family peptidyl-prolyl cis-trans isomerase